MTAVTRQQNANGTYRYRIAVLPNFAIDGSKVLYTHASIYGDPTDPVVTFHKSEQAAAKATRSHSAKLGVVEIAEA